MIAIFKGHFVSKKHLTSVLILSVITITQSYAQNASQRGADYTAERFMAITIDDLPVNTLIRGLTHREYVTDKILQALKKHKARGIGFVNEGKLYREGKLLDGGIGICRLVFSG